MNQHKPHKLYCEDENGYQTSQVCAWVHGASAESVRKVIFEVKEGNLDGRSKWCWVRLASGELILGVFPCGDTYFECEEDFQFPGMEE